MTGLTAPDGDRVNHGLVVEFRRYTLHPGRRDELIELFERAFVVPQQAAGMLVLGTFRDIDHPDRFTWFRGFADMAVRRRALETFYGGPVWAELRDAANATMIDSDDVHLLHGICDAASPGGSDPMGAARRFVTMTTSNAAPRPTDDPRWTTVLDMESLDAINDFPRLPVRTDRARVLVLACDDPTSPWPQAAAPTETFRLEPTASSYWR